MPRKLSDLGGFEGSLSGLGDASSEEHHEKLEAEAPGEEAAQSERQAEEEQASEALDSYSMTPRAVWLDDLKDAGVTTGVAAAILDTLMSVGHYSETYKIASTQFSFRTRTTIDADRTIELLQETKPDSQGVYSHLVSRINLASSLVSYAGTTFPHSKPTDENRELLDREWRARYRFCSTLPSPAFYTLSQVLQKFDQKVALASDARSLENF
jgi:hypothetical protein